MGAGTNRNEYCALVVVVPSSTSMIGTFVFSIVDNGRGILVHSAFHPAFPNETGTQQTKSTNALHNSQESGHFSLLMVVFVVVMWSR